MIPVGVPIPVDTCRPATGKFVAIAGCGFPSPAQDWTSPALDLVEWLNIDRAASFLFRCSGSSMTDAGLHDGDILVVDRDTTPTNGMIVVAVAEGGFIVRQLVTRPGPPRLEARNAANPSSPTLLDGTIEVWGVVRASVRSHVR